MLKHFQIGTIILGIALSNNALAIDCTDDTKLTNAELSLPLPSRVIPSVLAHLQIVELKSNTVLAVNYGITNMAL